MPEAVPPPEPVKVDQAVYETMSREQRRALGRRSGGKGRVIVLRKLRTTRADGKWDARISYRDFFRPGLPRNKWKRVRARLRRAGVSIDEQFSPRVLHELGMR